MEKKLIVALVLLLLTTVTIAKEPVLPLVASTAKAKPISQPRAKLQSEINQLISKYATNVDIGIKIQAMSTGQVLYQKNAARLFMPASNLKLFTATAALLFLGPDYRFNTVFYTNAPQIKDGVLHGNLYIRFTGAPDLTIADLNKMFAQLSKHGIYLITGNVYIDSSAYGPKPYGHGWMWDDLNYCYAAPAGAIMINHNCLKLTLHPASQIGDAAQVTGAKPFLYTPVSDAVKTGNPFSNDCKLDIEGSDLNSYRLSGCIPQGQYKEQLDLAIKNPGLFAKQNILMLLYQNYIVVAGEIKQGKVTPELNILAVHHSKPVRQLVVEMLKKSDNLIANTLFRTLGAKYFNSLGSWDNGSKAVTAILTTQAKLDLANAAIVDGDGQSRYDHVSPDQISQLLYFIYHDFAIEPELLAALPIAGADGTLQQRMIKMAYSPCSNEKEQACKLQNSTRIRAKTGSMTGVTALSGYAQTANHGVVSFVIMINGFTGSNKSYLKLENKIAELLSN